MFKKSFRDRNPYAIGLASVLVIGAFVGMAFMVGVLHLLEHTYKVTAVFSDASGIRGGDEVRVAGVKAGRVTKIKADHANGHVIVVLEVNKGVHLGPRTNAEIALATLLGTKYVRLSGPVVTPYLEDQPDTRRVIPVTRTKTPFDVFELTTLGARRVQQTDTEKLNRFITQLADVTSGNPADVQTLIDSVAKVSTAINQRDQQLSQLISRLDSLSGLLDDKDQTLVQLIDESRAVLDLVQRRRNDIARGLQGGDQLATELSRVLQLHEAQLDQILSTLHPTLDIVDKQQKHIDAALSYIGPGALGLSKAANHGPWADVYVRAVGPDLLQVVNDELTSKVTQP